jgi:DNA-binding beta-propeller fold protein YncE
MKHTNVLLYLTRGFLIAAVILLPTSVMAGSPWQWQTSLRIMEEENYMYMPAAVEFDTKNERYYVVDTGRNRLVSFDRKGKVLSAFTADFQLKSPFDMARLDNGTLWVVEKGRNSLTFIDVPNRQRIPRVVKDGGRLVFPDRIAASGGKLYVLDRSSGQVLRLNDKLTVEQRYGCTDCTFGLADFVIVNGSVWALEPRDRKVFRFNDDGSVAEEIPLGGKLEFPVSLAVEPSGIMYILDRHQNKVLVYDKYGNFSYSFLGPGQANDELYFPRQIRIDPWGQLCIVDEGNGRVAIYRQ